MGKLAERYTDAARSGLYRVRDGTIARTAAHEANACLVEIGVAALADGGWPRVAEAIAAPPGAPPCIVLIPDAAALVRTEHHAVVQALRDAARSCTEARRPFFAVLVDPGGDLPFPALYREKAPE